MATSYDTAVLLLNPSSYWTMSELSGNFADSVAGNDLVPAGGPPNVIRGVSTGKIGLGLGVNFGDQSAYAKTVGAIPQIPADKFSLAGWFLINSTDQQRLFSANVAAFASPFYVFDCSAGFVGTRWVLNYTILNANRQDIGPVASVDFGVWQFLAMIYDGATMQMYKNGTSILSTVRTGNNGGTIASFGLNCTPENQANRGDCRACSVGYWNNYALTSTDQATLIAAASTPPPPPDPSVGIIQPIVRGRFA